MPARCPQCGCVIVEASGKSAPKFCSECGVSLLTNLSQGGSADDATAVLRTGPVSSGSTEFDTVTRMPSSDSVTDGANAALDIPAGLESVGPYRLVRKLGQGGMGSVFEAVHAETQQRVALKLLMPMFRKTDESVQRFRRESQIAASINHPRSTFVFEAGEHADKFYITMELMDGGTLKDVVSRDGPLEVGRAVDYVLDIIEGLRVAHTAGIVHRDLKPSNCFIDQDGRVKIGDFGLAKSFSASSQLTQTGQFMGTPQYAAPEQLRSSEVDARADIYAIGATLYYLLTGRAPFEGDAARVIAAIASEPAPDVRRFAPNVPRDLARLISQMLEKDPVKRPSNLDVLVDGLHPFASQGASLADVGRRMAAFFIDFIIAGFLANFVAQLVTFLVMVVAGNFGGLSFSGVQATAIATQFLFMIGYFAVGEHLWGRCLGKWLLGMRVIAENGEPPQLRQSIVRTLLVPGLTWMANAAPATIVMGNYQPDSIDSAISMITQLQVIGLLSWLPTLLCMLTARQSNGYRGLHEIVSGTRVVRLGGELESRRLDTASITVPVQVSSDREFGHYQVIGQFNERMPHVYLARDRSLDRDVWIFEGEGLAPLSETRRKSTRPHRLRVIHDGTQHGESWFATEAVRGCPLAETLDDRRCVWQSSRPLFRELAAELQAAEDEGTVPADLDVDHVWIDNLGRIELLDYPVVNSTVRPDDDAREPSTSTAAPTTRLFARLLDHYVQRHDVPFHVLQLRDQLKSGEFGDQPLRHIVARLTEFANRPASFRWDDRLGVMAISLGLELSLITSVVYLIGLVGYVLDVPANTLAIASIVLTMLIAGVIGAVTRGGIAFRMSEVCVLGNRSRRPVSRWRCGLRYVVAWFPIIVFNSFFFYLLKYAMTGQGGRDAADLDNATLFLLVLLISMVPLGMVMVGNIAIALLSPARSLPDWIVGTRLARK